MKELDNPRYRCETIRFHSRQLGPLKDLKPNDHGERVYPPGRVCLKRSISGSSRI